ncbi:hypothetical protein SUDANB58_05333 [Streptomyces sp. enrichment culture]
MVLRLVAGAPSGASSAGFSASRQEKSQACGVEPVGTDVAAFCDNLIKDSRTYADVYQESIGGEPGASGK